MRRFLASIAATVILATTAIAQTAESVQAEDNAARADGAEIVSYRQVDGRSLKAYVYLPKTAGKSRPAILLFHGGAWQLGDASWMFGRAKEFAADGIVAISVDYTLANDGHTPMDGIADAVAAFAWTRRQAVHYGIDPKRVAGYGWSAGGHLVAAVATLPAVNGKKITPDERPNALLMYSPALNMAKDPYFTRIMLGKADPALYSPSDYISKSLVPSLIIQGEEDTIVYAKDAKAFCEMATQAGARCELHMYPGVGHLLTRNLKVQYKDFDSDPAFAKEAHGFEDKFLVSLGYLR